MFCITLFIDSLLQNVTVGSLVYSALGAGGCCVDQVTSRIICFGCCLLCFVLAKGLSSYEAAALTVKKSRERERDRQTDRQTETERQRETERKRQRQRDRDRQTERQRQRDRDGQTDRDRQTEAERQRHRQTDRHRQRLTDT